jgi:hypothetical protein
VVVVVKMRRNTVSGISQNLTSCVRKPGRAFTVAVVVVVMVVTVIVMSGAPGLWWCDGGAGGGL